MQKIKYKILENMIKKTATRIELSVLLYLSRYQDDTGLVTAVYYKNVCTEMSISIQSFYNAIHNLEKKELIKCSKKNDNDWNIVIVGNNFLTEDGKIDQEKLKEGYLNTNMDIFESKQFWKLKAGEKMLLLDLLKTCMSGQGKHHIKVSNFYSTYGDKYQITARALRGYLKNLKRFFAIGIKNGEYWITPLKQTRQTSPGKESEENRYRKRMAKELARRNKIINPTEHELDETGKLIAQYRNRIGGNPENIIIYLEHAIQDSIKTINEAVKGSKKWVYELRYKLVHKCLKRRIEADF